MERTAESIEGPPSTARTQLSAALTDNGLEVWGGETYMIIPSHSGLLKHEDASGQRSFSGVGQELLRALSEIKTDDPMLKAALQESMAYGNKVLAEQRFIEQVAAAYRSGQIPAEEWGSGHQAIYEVIHAALSSKRTIPTTAHAVLRCLVKVAVSFNPPPSLDASDWLELVTRSLRKA